MSARFWSRGSLLRWVRAASLVGVAWGCALAQAGAAVERTPQQREAAAAAQAAQAGELTSLDAAGYQRNALARCEVFRTEEDRQDCRDRLGAKAQVQGSVEGGGLLREEVKTWLELPR